MYFEQIVLAELLRQNAIESKLNFNIIIPIVAVISIGVIAVIFVIVKWLIPALAKLRSRVLV